MESQVCIHCLNKKIINSTTNRLVTESCGHVKCMDCLLHEKAGCVACAEKTSLKEPEDTPEPSDGLPPDGDNVEPAPVHADFTHQHFLLEEYQEKGAQTEFYYDKNDKKKKLETSHIRIETDGNRRYYFCTACKRKFQARSQVSYHAYCNGQQKPYQCPECNKSFASHSHFKYHMRVHRNERTYACEQCGESFFQMSKLQRHKLKHTKEKKYSCGECSKAFNNLTSLRKHALTHSDERPFGCETCGRRFRDSSNYRKHQAKHNGSGCARACACGACGRRRARAHVCPRCPQAFAARRDMRRHAAVHTDLKPFRCRVCARRFRRKDNLERHVRNTHPAAPPAAAAAAAAAHAQPDMSAKHKVYQSEKLDPTKEKTKLESLNPLPPLPPELIQQHLQEDEKVQKPPSEDKNAAKCEVKMEQALSERKEQKSAEILAANHARRSVICAPARRAPPAAAPAEYVHKIRKANRRLPALLPPIDERKISELVKLGLQNNLDVGAPPEKFRALYKKILYERSGQEAALHEEQHWKKKKLNINW